MKIVLGTHTLRGYPPSSRGVPDPAQRRNLFAWAQRRGFAGIEVGHYWLDFHNAGAPAVLQVKREMEDFGLEMAGWNSLGHCVTNARVAQKNREELRRAVEVAALVRPRVLNISLSISPAAAGVPADRVRGLTEPSPCSSRAARPGEFEEAADFLRQLAEQAAQAGVALALELHHCSLGDNSRSLLHLLELVGHPNLSPNPDLGNLYWAYATPEEPWHEAVERLAGCGVQFWHVKNVQRVNVPEVGHAFFLHAALGEGDIDYRWALGRLVRHGFDGYLIIEGAGPGDALAFAERSKAYLDTLLADLSVGTGMEMH